MNRPAFLPALRLGSLILVMAAIVAQAVVLADAGAFDPTRFFAFFTIQSNLVGVAAFLWLLVVGRRRRSRALELLRGAAAVYLTVTFFVVIFLLSGVDVQLQLVWVDVALHKIFPVIIVLDWILDPPMHRLGARDLVMWLIYPLIWTVLTVIRGALDGWYPYPFLDPANGGYGQVAIVVVAVLVGFIGISAAILAIGNARSRGQTTG
ncbi:MAG: Pr6Pr family membrane protein [Chloroflexi bacterium]|nr:Pr6Pr family membrane protein [Chloroflexota bacterium]